MDSLLAKTGSQEIVLSVRRQLSPGRRKTSSDAAALRRAWGRACASHALSVAASLPVDLGDQLVDLVGRHVAGGDDLALLDAPQAEGPGNVAVLVELHG